MDLNAGPDYEKSGFPTSNAILKLRGNAGYPESHKSSKYDMKLKDVCQVSL